MFDTLTHTRLGRRRRTVAVAIGVAVTCAAANVHDGTATANTGPVSSAPPTVEGCGPGAFTDQADRSNDRAVARCAPGAPAPQPLDERRTITVAIGTYGEITAPVILADVLGEFDAENIDVEVVRMAATDALPQVASGQFDAVQAGPFAQLFNAVDSGLELKMVLANFSQPDGGNVDVPQGGVWMRRDSFSDPDNPDLAEMAGMTIGNAVGFQTVAVYWMEAVLNEHGVSVADLTFQQLPTPDQLGAVQQGAIDGAYLSDSAFWKPLAEEPDTYVLVAVPPREPTGAFVFGPTLLSDDREAGLAFVRAYIRTINTYLADESYKQDEVMQVLADAAEVPVDVLRESDPLLFEWEIRAGMTDQLQELFIRFGVQQTDEVVPESEVVDRWFYQTAVGASG